MHDEKYNFFLRKCEEYRQRGLGAFVLSKEYEILKQQGIIQDDNFLLNEEIKEEWAKHCGYHQ